MDVKAEIQGKEDFKTKLEESLKRKESVDVARKVAKMEKERLKRQIDELRESKEELQKRYGQLVEVQNFWATEGAGIAVQTCLRSPKIYNWLLEFVGVMINIGYSTRVKAMYTSHLKSKNPKDFPDFAKGDADAADQIKRRIERLRSGQMDFEFLEYFTTSPSLSFEEIREVDVVAYRRLDGSYDGVIEARPTVPDPEPEPAA